MKIMPVIVSTLSGPLAQLSSRSRHHLKLVWYTINAIYLPYFVCTSRQHQKLVSLLIFSLAAISSLPNWGGHDGVRDLSKRGCDAQGVCRLL